MKASELINKLQDLISDYGDCDVSINDWSEQYSEPGNCNSVYTYEEDGRTIFVLNN